MPAVEDDYYTTDEAAKALGMGARRVQQLIAGGHLVGKKGTGRAWLVDKRSVHAYLEDHGPTKPRVSRPEAPQIGREYLDRVAALERELGRLEGRLELTATAESTLRERLEREQARADRLERELESERAKGFWQRLLGR